MKDAPVEPRLAATVVLVRPGRAGLEVLLTKRPASMAFAPDVHVFPGGRVDPGDADPALLARSLVGPEAAARALGGDLEPTLALAAHVAAVRELFEEAGVLLADVEADATGTAEPVAVPARSLGRARTALVSGETTFAAVAAELGLRLRTDRLVPLSRWVTPSVLRRRFDARFFAAALPSGARVSFEGGEVVDHAWRTPGGALRAMGEGEISMWLPTSATLQQLEYADSADEMRECLAPRLLGEIGVEVVAPGITRIVMPAGGGVAGQPVCAYLLGRRRHLLVDPGDPTGPALDRVLELVAARAGSIEAVVLTHADPDHAGGTEAAAVVLGVPVFAGAGAGRSLPYAILELADLESLTMADVEVTAIHTPGPRPEHLAFVVGRASAAVVLSGDLDGERGARSIVGPIDEPARLASIERLRWLAPDATWFPGHPAPAMAGD